MILVTFALPYEGYFFEKAIKNDPNIAILYTGVGPLRTKQALDEYLASNRPELIVAAGFAGGLAVDIERGDIIVDFEDSWAPAPVITGKLQQAGYKLQKGRILTSDSVLDTASDRKRVQESTGAVAVDMESRAIKESASIYGIRVAGLRIITDSVHEPLPVPADVLFDSLAGKAAIGRLVVYLSTHPWRIAAMLRFAKSCNRCRRQLADALALSIGS